MATSHGGGSGGSPPTGREPLIGGVGKDLVQEILAAKGPREGIPAVQEACLMPYPLVRHLLGMLEVMDVTRFEAHRAVLQRAKERLLSRVAALDCRADKARLERLLAASFPYLGMSDMREVPLAVMERLERVPAPHLKQLAADTEVFKILPPGVQRQVWEYDKNLLQNDALPLVGAYKYETATYMRALAADEFLPAVLAAAQRLAAAMATASSAATNPSAAGTAADRDSLAGVGGRGPGGLGVGGRQRGGAGVAAAAAAARVAGSHLLDAAGSGGPGSGGVVGITRKILRKGSRITQALKGMVGSSPKIYTQVAAGGGVLGLGAARRVEGVIVELCCVKFRDAEGLYVGVRECSYAALRSQLLMALHDDNNPVAPKDRRVGPGALWCHELAWTLDAGIRNGGLSDKHLEKLGRFFEDIVEAADEAERLGGSKRRRGAAGPLPAAGGRPSRAPLDEADAAGAGGHGGGAGGVVEPLRVLGDAGLVLRDPSAMHLLAAQVLSLLQSEVVAAERLPRDVPDLVLVVRLMQLAVECRSMLRDRSYRCVQLGGALRRANRWEWNAKTRGHNSRTS
ncbi:Negative elongation factor B [Tetrabaena socialis]|uniref:Negative elongation factor B n=1 Tax=Tetrabaena socialis TaxID=47790 RepID=A0A2J7ZKR1_9CHLO|nr:Negative elongation factor B [Tetrabaena socialis]|eukprot:PNH00841.1 Negative elongation factor B [Tetrabaena socialis]